MTTVPDLRFCRSSDGVRLAMAAGGGGPVVVKVANWLSHLEHEADLFASRHWISELGRGHRLVRYDARGCGLSDRDVQRISLEAWVDDLSAVVEAQGDAPVVLFGVSQGASAALAYAARHPQRVRGLVLFGAFARGMLRQSSSARVAQAARALIGVAELGWGHDTAAFRDLFSRHILCSATPAEMKAFDQAHRHTVTGPMAARYMEVFYNLDVRELVSQVRCPTLVMHSQGDRLVLPREGQLIASMIPGARWVALDSPNHLVLENEPAWKVVQAELRAFLSVLDRQEQAGLAQLTPRQREVLSAVARGLTDKAIARELGLSPRTVEMHVARAMAALDVRNRTEAVHVAAQQHLLGHPGTVVANVNGPPATVRPR